MLRTMASVKSSSRSAIVPDERQQEAIAHVLGPMLVVAGAGTGKTTVLTRRVARLIREGHARPNEILALTYTDNAAGEMLERVQAELQGSEVSGLQAMTFHKYCNELLIGNGKGFGVLDDKDLWIYLRRRLRDLPLNYFIRAANVTQFLDDLLDFMRRCHDELVGPEKYQAYVRRVEVGELPVPRVAKSKDAVALTDEEILGRCREIASVFSRVERMLQDENLGTFSHMITRALDLLQHDGALLEQQRKRARFVLVDEFQDANFAQVKLLSMLAGETRNVFAVGDPDQAIYRFRGASSAAFGLFYRSFPGARLVVLEKNQRSTTPILQCAFALINQNPPVFAGPENGYRSGAAQPVYRRAVLQSARDERALREGQPVVGAPVEVVPLSAKDFESADVIGVLQQKHRQSRCRWKDFAILYRSHFHRDEIARELGEKGIPFTIESMDVLDTPEVRDLLACLGAVNSTADAASLLRVSALPRFGIDPEKFRAAMRAVPREQQSGSVTLASLLREIEGGLTVLDSLKRTREEIAQSGGKSHAALVMIARDFGCDRTSPPLQALLKFVFDWEKKPLTKTGEIGEFLDYLQHFREARGVVPLQSGDDDAVRLMTAHAAKGLEFPHVFLIRANSNSFPCAYREPLVEFPQELRDPDSMGDRDGKALHDQEERRLFYVAMTRARDTLILYGKQGAGKDKTPPGLARELLKDPGLRRWLVQRPARAFQTDLFAEAAPLPAFVSRTAEWLSLPAAFPLNRLSPTAIESYEVCPLQFKLEREWRIPRDVPAAMQYGAAMHRVLRTYFDAVRQGRVLADEQLVEMFREDFAQLPIDDAYQRELYEQQGIQQLRDFLEGQRQLPAPRVLHTEEQFEMRVGNATVAGRIDRIDDLGDGRVAIVDYKTGKPRAQEDADESLQLSVYALAAQEKWGYAAERLVFYNLEENSAVMTRRDRFQLDQAKAKVRQVADQIEAGQFEPKPGYHCRLCSYRNLCPATEKPLYTISPAKKAATN
jgi:DNA helicase II / ATP-dependent DNA helicase PcrA